MTGLRYARQIPVISPEGQERLADASVLIVGAGGLGSPVATYLTLAGTGELIIADPDQVHESDLNRQFLHATRSIGQKKVYSATETLHSLNPDITISAIPDAITQGTISRYAKDVEIIVDATDNFQARFILNEFSHNHNIPLVHGAVQECFGQVTTIIPGKTPCLSCIFPDVFEGGETAIIGAAAGVIGSMQALEVIKWITGTGELLAGRLMVWDGLSGRSELLNVSKRKDCQVCR